MKVLVADELSAEGLEVLRKAPGITVDVRTGLKPAELKALIGEYDVLAVRSATKVTADVLESAGRLEAHRPRRRRRGQHRRRGRHPQGRDGDEHARRNSVAVAELTIAPDAGAAPAAGPGDRRHPGRAGGRRSGSPAGTSCSARRWGCSASVSIGQLVAQRCIAFGATVIAYDPHPVEASRRLGAQIVPLAELFQRADIVSLHLPARGRHPKSRRRAAARLDEAGAAT